MLRIFRFIKFAWGLLKFNAGTLFVFEILYKFSMMAVFRPILMVAFRQSLKVRGLSYLSDETIGLYLQGPMVWIILFLLILCLAFFTVFDICCIITCLHASYRKQKMPLLALLRRGALASLQIFKRKNWLMILYLLIIIPMTHFALINGYISEFVLPEFIFDYIKSHTLLFAAYIVFWIYIGYRSFHWIYSLHYFCLEKKSFKEARRGSWTLIKGHFWKDILVLLIWNGVVLGIYYGVIMGGAYLISAVNRGLADSDLFSSLTLSGISILLGVMGILYFCACLPVVYLCISMQFYYRKAKIQEPIAGPYRDLDRAYRLKDTRWAGFLYDHRKRIIGIAVIVALTVNFVYSFGEKKGVINLGFKEEVQITAHRGYSAEYPENTMPAFQGAVQIGADCIELDVQQTKDGEIIVMHDSNLKRTTGIDKNIWETTYEELRYLDAGSWFDPKFKETVIPTLDEVLQYTRGKINVNIELKPTGHETDFEQKVLDIIEKNHCQRECYVSSMKYECLENVKKINPKIQTVYITSVSLGNFTVLDAADIYSVEAMMLTSKFINQAHRAGKKVLVWTINTEESMDRVLKMNVDGIITDKPTDAQQLIHEKRHSGWWDHYIEKLLSLQ